MSYSYELTEHIDKFVCIPMPGEWLITILYPYYSDVFQPVSFHFSQLVLNKIILHILLL